MEELGLAYGLTKFLHVLLFVYWLGGDVGVFYSSSFVVNPKLTREARLTAFKIFNDLDMIPRYCMALMLTVGGILSEFVGLDHPTWQTIGIWLLGPVWLALVYFVHAKTGTDAGRQLAKIDLWFRVIIIGAILASVAWSLSTGRLDGYAWIAAKLVIFAFLIFCGLMIRVFIPPFIQGFRQLASPAGATPESDELMRAGLARCKPWVLAIWAGVAASALLGILKP